MARVCISPILPCPGVKSKPVVQVKVRLGQEQVSRDAMQPCTWECGQLGRLQVDESHGHGSRVIGEVELLTAAHRSPARPPRIYTRNMESSAFTWPVPHGCFSESGTLDIKNENLKFSLASSPELATAGQRSSIGQRSPA